MTVWTPDGRPAQWATETEPEWDHRQRSLMLALDMWEAGLCRRCHEHVELSTDPDTDPDSPWATRAWVAEDPTECFSCKALTRSERKWSDPKTDTEGQAAWLIHTTGLVSKTPRLRR